MVVIKREQALGKQRADSLLHFLGIWMHQPVSKGITSGLMLLRRHPIPILIEQAPRAKYGNENGKSHDEGPKRLGEQSLHQRMILELGMSRGERIEASQPRTTIRGWRPFKAARE